MQKQLPALSNKSMEEFHNKVGDISFDIIRRSSIEFEDIENEINSQYNCNIKLERCALVECKYHDDFGEEIFEVIKIDGRWYLCHISHFPNPIQYFAE